MNSVCRIRADGRAEGQTRDEQNPRQQSVFVPVYTHVLVGIIHLSHPNQAAACSVSDAQHENNSLRYITSLFKIDKTKIIFSHIFTCISYILFIIYFLLNYILKPSTSAMYHNH